MAKGLRQNNLAGSKSETRSTKSQTNPKHQAQTTKSPHATPVSIIRALNFVLVSDLVLRI
jgi:hypothetical protein